MNNWQVCPWSTFIGNPVCTDNANYYHGMISMGNCVDGKDMNPMLEGFK